MKKSDQNQGYFFKAWLTSPITVGLLVTLLFVFSAYSYYQVRNLNDSERKPSIFSHFFDIVEWAELKSMDLRFRWRGELEPTAPVALLAVDDRSLEKVGRWPWSREKIAHVIDQMFHYGAKAIAMDIVFAEPQADQTLVALERIEQKSGKLPPYLKSLFEQEKQKANPDQILAQTIQKHKNKIVLGSFNNEESLKDQNHYQDYCRNEAFKLSNSSQFVNPLNATLIVDDKADDFVDIQFDQVVGQILKEYIRNQPQYQTEELMMDFCSIWLTDQDPTLKSLDVQNAYLTLFEKNKILKGLPFLSAIEKFKKMVKSHPIPQKNRWTINHGPIQANSEYTGAFNAEQDNDGSIRKAPLFLRTGNRIGTSFVPSISLQVFLIATGLQARIEIDNDPQNKNQKLLTRFDIYDTSKEPESLYAHIPVDGQGRLNINYAGGAHSFVHVPAKELLTDRSTMTVSRRMYDPELKRRVVKTYEVEKKNFIQDKVFVFGATAIGIYDLRVTPFEKNFPGQETHVNVIANLFDRNFVRPIQNEHQWMLLTLLFLGLGLTILYHHVGANFGLIITIVTMAIVIGLDQFLFSRGLFTAMVLPFFMVITVYVTMTFYKYFTEERKKKHLRATFSKYVSPAIVDEILKSPEGIELGGKKQRMTVFFSDVRGFTTISESLDPAQLSSVLNRYLTPMTQIVFQNKGTLDKYMGDAVMAFFGAPIFFPDHAIYACRCALQSIQKLKEIQTEFEKEGLPKIDIGIGINSAEMSVGNMGSDIVRNYTVMGDAVNLGSRLEGITKEYGTRIIISEFTYQDIRDHFTCREIDWVRVKGKKKPVKIYELICEGPPSIDWKENIHHFNQGFDLFHQSKFQKALECFEKAFKCRGADSISKLYMERCQDYISSGPADDWDGVYNIKTK